MVFPHFDEDALEEIYCGGVPMSVFPHGRCEHFALTLAERYGYKVMIWMDGDGEGNSFFTHAFNTTEIDGRTVYIDIRGVTDNWDDITDGFDYWEHLEPDCVGALTLKEAEAAMDELGIVHDDENLLAAARKFVEEHDEVYRVSAAMECKEGTS